MIYKHFKKALLFVLRNIPAKQVKANIVTIAPNTLLKHKVAFITGGSSGIGLAIAKTFVNNGATVVITGRNPDKLEKAKREIEGMNQFENRVIIQVLDNTNIKKYKQIIDNILQRTGRIDILVNNAGIMGGNLPTVDEMEFDRIMNTNLKGPFFFSRLVATYMIENKIKGNILNICSSSSFRPVNSVYALSKWGMRGLTIGLAKYLAKYGITVNGIAPGPTATPMLGQNENNNIDNKYNPIGRMAMPEEIANMALFLVSDLGKTMPGEVVCMSGGAGIFTYDDIRYDFE